MFRDSTRMIAIKSEAEIELMRVSGAVLAQILNEMAEMLGPGMSTMDVDEYAERRCAELKVIPAFKGYRGFPGSVCVSVNEQVVHGVPSRSKILKEGDIVGLDFGVIREGWYADSARSVGVGKVSVQAQKLVDATAEGLRLGIEQCREGNRVFDIGHAIQKYVESFGYGVVREFVGHGIGKSLHEEPQVPNFGPKGKGVPLKAGMVLAIEPMINAGSPEVRVLEDGWTAVTADSSLSAHFEHTVAITRDGPKILTLV